MPTYKDIQDAFARSCETGSQLRWDAYAVAKSVFRALIERGQMKDVLHLHPSDRTDIDRKTTFTFAGATRHNSQTNLWEIGFWLDVRRGQDIFPREALRFTVTLKQTPGKYTIALEGSEVSQTFAPDQSAETEAAFFTFADAVIAAIAKYYDSQRAYWLNEDQKERIVGFHAQA